MQGLMTHAGVHATTLEQLQTIPAPIALGPRHRPVPHAELVSTILDGMYTRGFSVTRTALAVTDDNAKLFGVLDIQNGDGWARQLGFRNSTDESMSIRGVAGRRVLVCDNMALSGDEFSFSRKNTLNVRIIDVVLEGISRWESQTEVLHRRIESLASVTLTDDQAKGRIYDALVGEVVPKSLLGEINTHYFAPAPSEDCAPRNAWGLHNAFTRALKTLKSPGAQFQRTIDVGRHFGI